MIATAHAHIAFRRGVARGFRHIVRDRSWGTSLLLFTALLLLTDLLALFLIGVLSVNRFLVSRAAVHVEVLGTARQQDIQEFNAALRAEPYVENAAFVPREQAYEQQRRTDPDLIAFLEEYKLENPFPDTFEVTLAQLDAYEEFRAFLQQDRWKQVVDSSAFSQAAGQEQQVRTLLQITSVIRTLALVFLGVALLLLCFVILEWVAQTLLRRREELFLERLLGAARGAALIPLVTEMSVLLLAAAVAGAAVLALLLIGLPALLPSLSLDLPLQDLEAQLIPLLSVTLPAIVATQLFAMPLLAFGGTLLGVRMASRKGAPLLS